MGFRPRPKQQEVLEYSGGKMGIAAVPGSGKTVLLSCLAAKLVAEGDLSDDQEVLIVTLVNSAVENFARQVAAFVRERGLMAGMGYRVRTLHGLAHDIVRERPGLVGLPEGFEVLDEPATQAILRQAVHAWLKGNAQVAESYLDPHMDDNKRRNAIAGDLPELMVDVAQAVVKKSKDLQLSPAELRACLDAFPLPLPLAEMGCQVYADYQRALSYRGAVDFADLVRLALQALQLDPAYLERLRHRWPFILEDEAQDSDRLQEEILRLLVGPEGNWVRVGDPNQAIYETFTTASPRYLLSFLEEEGVKRCELPNSGRSTQSIIDLANYLMRWSRTEHPVAELRLALSPPYIEPAPEGDSQPNPPDAPRRLRLSTRKQTAGEELQGVVESLARCLREQPECTVAVLVPRNERGASLVRELRKRRLPYVELLRSTSATRRVAEALSIVVDYLADPLRRLALADVLKVWQALAADSPEPVAAAARAALKQCLQVENFLYPRVQGDWLGQMESSLGSAACHQLGAFRERVRRWLAAVPLPVDQLILTISQDLFREPTDLAVSHQMAVLLRRTSETHPYRGLAELNQELRDIARNQRKLVGPGEDDTGFDPDEHRGKVVVATMHKAKGLEWDRVYLMSVNNYDFPSAQPHDSYFGEKDYVRDGLNLEAEAQAQVEAVCGELTPGPSLERRGETPAPPSRFGKGAGGSGYTEGEATQAARLEYAAERLRLLYVGITRARRELVVSSNTGRDGQKQPATPLIALGTWWEENGRATAE